MRLTTTAYLAALALPLIHLDSGEELRFSPEEGLELTVTFEQESSSELVENEVSFLVNGEENEGVEAAEVEIERTFFERIVISDEILEVEDGRPTRVRRVFDEIQSLSSEQVTDEQDEEHESENARVSELEGLGIEFRWDDGEEQYEKSFEDDEDAEERLLEPLELTGYLAELLPDREVEEGDEWELEAGVFRTLIYPGGELSYVDADEDAEEQSEEEIAKQADWDEQYADNLSGEITLEHLGLREVDGVELLVIAVNVDVETSIEQEEELTVEINEEEGEGTKTQTYSFSIEVEGELLWNPELGHPVSLELTGENEFEYVDEQEMAAGGMEVVITATKLFEGTVEYRYTFE